MKVIIAPDKFKGSLTAFEACEAIRAGIGSVDTNIETLCFPMADGGDGFAQVMQYYVNSKTITCKTVDPLGRELTATYQWQETQKLAIIEMATASGLVLLKKEEQNPLRTSTYGTGLLIKHAIDAGAKKIILGLGGSATNDAGMGVLVALGFKFFDKTGTQLRAAGESLNKVATMEAPASMPNIIIDIACDVQNVLHGKNGAAHIYAPQKGATASEVIVLDNGLRNFAAMLLHVTKRDVSDIPGVGAAGGVAAALIPFFNVHLKSGIEMLMEVSGIVHQLADADLLITGEGKIDRQTASGKVIQRLAMLANQNHVPTIAFCGILQADEHLLQGLHLKTVESIAQHAPNVEEAMLKANKILSKIVAKYFAERYT
jgi:glycerate kinase